jgi:hypothetical protein
MTDTDTTTLVVEGTAEAAAAIDKFATSTLAALDTSMPTTPPAIKGFFANLLDEIEAIPDEVTAELSKAKMNVLSAMAYLERHFTAAKATAETDVASIKTDATDVQAAVEKAV